MSAGQRSRVKHLVAWLCLNLTIFVACYLNYRYQLKHRYLYRMLNVGLCFSRAAAMVINFNLLLVWIPMCKYSLTKIAFIANVSLRRQRQSLGLLLDRSSGATSDESAGIATPIRYIVPEQHSNSSIWSKLASKLKKTTSAISLRFGIAICVAKINSINSFLIAVDHCRSLHTICASTITIASVIHTVAHLLNVINFSRNFDPLLSNLNMAEYKGQNPFQLLLSVPGLTGSLMLIILVLMSLSSVDMIRNSSYDLFRIFHRLSIVFVLLLALHPSSHILKEQINLERHNPELCEISAANRTLPTQQMVSLAPALSHAERANPFGGGPAHSALAPARTAEQQEHALRHSNLSPANWPQGQPEKNKTLDRDELAAFTNPASNPANVQANGAHKAISESSSSPAATPIRHTNGHANVHKPNDDDDDDDRPHLASRANRNVHASAILSRATNKTNELGQGQPSDARAQLLDASWLAWLKVGSPGRTQQSAAGEMSAPAKTTPSSTDSLTAVNNSASVEVDYSNRLQLASDLPNSTKVALAARATGQQDLSNRKGACLDEFPRSKSSIELLDVRLDCEGNLIELILSNNHSRFKRWLPGQFVYLNCPQIAAYEWHPFTISSMSNAGRQFTLHIKTGGDWTRKLREKLELRKDSMPVLNRKQALSFIPAQGKGNENIVRRASQQLDGVTLPGLECYRESGKAKQIECTRIVRILDSREHYGREECYDDDDNNCDDAGQVVCKPKYNPQVHTGVYSICFESQRNNTYDNNTNNDTGDSKSVLDLFIDGPFHSPFERLLEQQVSVCIANGVGWTAFSSIFQYIINELTSPVMPSDCSGLDWWPQWRNFNLDPLSSSPLSLKAASAAQTNPMPSPISGTRQLLSRLHLVVIVTTIEQLKPFYFMAQDYFDQMLRKGYKLGCSSERQDNPVKGILAFVTRSNKFSPDVREFCTKEDLCISCDPDGPIIVNEIFSIQFGKPDFEKYLASFSGTYFWCQKISVYCCGSYQVKRSIQEICKDLNKTRSKSRKLFDKKHQPYYSYHEENF